VHNTRETGQLSTGYAVDVNWGAYSVPLPRPSLDRYSHLCHHTTVNYAPSGPEHYFQWVWPNRPCPESTITPTGGCRILSRSVRVHFARRTGWKRRVGVDSGLPEWEPVSGCGMHSTSATTPALAKHSLVSCSIGLGCVFFALVRLPVPEGSLFLLSRGEPRK